MVANQFICLIDDDADYRLIFQTFFKRLCPDYGVQCFSDGKAFADALPRMKSPPHLILLDRHMPQWDGHQTLEFLKQHPAYKRIPVVMMSAHATVEEINDCYEAGVNSFLAKSVDGVRIQKAIEAVCQYWLDFNLMPSYQD